MKKFIMVLVCLMTIAVSAKAQLIKIEGVSKQTNFYVYDENVEECFTKACRDSKENLWRYNIKYHKIKEAAVRKFKRGLIAPSQFILSNLYGDKITIDDLNLTEFTTDTGKKYWSVFVTGDAKNNVGGYVHINDFIYVYGTEKNPIID